MTSTAFQGGPQSYRLLGKGDKLKIFTFYSFLDFKIWRRSKPCQRRQKIEIDLWQPPCTWGLKVFRSSCRLVPMEMPKIKNLNSFLTMVKLYSNKPRINHIGILNRIWAAFVDATVIFKAPVVYFYSIHSHYIGFTS